MAEQTSRASRVDGEELWRQLRQFIADSGTTFIQPLVARQNEGDLRTSTLASPFGYLILSAPAVEQLLLGDLYTLSLFDRSGSDSVPAVAEQDLLLWLGITATGRGVKIGDDLRYQLAEAREYARRDAEQQAEPPSPREALESTERRRLFLNTMFRNLSSMDLLADLGKPASEVLPDRPRVRKADECGSEPTLGQYVATAVALGDAPALKAIVALMRSRVRRGDDNKDWATILREYRYTWRALDDLAIEWAAGTEHGQLTDQTLVKRLCKARLTVEQVADGPVTAHARYARQLVARERHTTPNTIRKMWKARRLILPKQDWLYNEKSTSEK